MARDTKAILCPYCGLMQPQASSDDSGTGQRCSFCGGLFDPLSRKATQIAMGPWYIRDKANPFRPGCCFEVLKRQIEAGKIKATTVLRGPTTRQFWAIARNVPGVGHLLGYCPRCGTKVSKTDVACPECAEPFMEPNERNELGLVYATKSAAEHAFKQLEREVEGGPPIKAEDKPTPKRTSEKRDKADKPDASVKPKRREEWQPGLDLLDEVIGGPLTVEREPAGVSPAKAKLAAMSASAGDPRSETSQRKRPTAAAVKLGSAIDFSPSDDSADEAPPTPPTYIVQNRNTQLVIWLLLAVNLLLLPILVGALLYFMGVFDREPETTQPTRGVSVFDSGFDDPPREPEATWPPLPQQPAQAQSQTPPARAIETPQPVDVRVEPTPGPQPTGPTPAFVRAVDNAIAEAQRLEDEGELTKAITLLKDIQQKTRPADRPADLEARIARIQEKIDRAESADFFGMPVNDR
jgi:hypothetical protein